MAAKITPDMRPDKTGHDNCQPVRIVSSQRAPAPLSPTLQALIDSHDRPYVLIDEHYAVVGANSAYLAHYGVAANAVVGRHCYEISHHLDSPCWQHGEDCPHHEVFRHGRNSELLHVHYDAKGEPEHVQIRGYLIPRPEGGRLLGETITRLSDPVALDCDDMQLIGRSPAFLRALDHLSRAAASQANVMLVGESGVGKELAAHYLHQHSPRKAAAFLTVDCAALTESLFESEVFGHEPGAFTGCVGRKQGLFELAHDGTLFLDEVGELTASMQAKLLRVLESGEFRRIGGREVLYADVRVVAATNRDLRKMVAAGRFREDLYYRLACVVTELPPLRERRSDIPALAEALLARINQANRTHCYLTGEAMDVLVNHDYPGNVRELRNVVSRAAALCGGNCQGAIRAVDITFDERAARPGAAGVTPAIRLQDVEARHLDELLRRHGGRRRLVAEVLGISERTLYRKLRKHSIGSGKP